MRKSRMFAIGFLALAFTSVVGGSISHAAKAHKLTRPATLQSKAIKALAGVATLDRPIGFNGILSRAG